MIRCRIKLILAQREHVGERPIYLSELAEMAGLPASTVSRLANDKGKRFDRNTLDAVCQALGVGIGDILVYTPDS
jgi:DNA-binding Xre family transcriptional regulator